MMEKSIPVLFADDSECCGCGACVVACPKGAISMVPNRYGFLYPKIEEDASKHRLIARNNLKQIRFDSIAHGVTGCP